MAWLARRADEGVPAAPERVSAHDGSLWLDGFVAVGFDQPIVASPVVVDAEVDPMVGSPEGLGWVSFILARTQGLGWPTEAYAVASVLVRSNGEVEVWSGGTLCPVTWEAKAKPRNTHALHGTLWDGGGELHLAGTLDGAAFSAELPPGELPDELWLAVGSHGHPGDNPLSRLDSLQVAEANWACGPEGRMRGSSNAEDPSPALRAPSPRYAGRGELRQATGACGSHDQSVS